MQTSRDLTVSSDLDNLPFVLEFVRLCCLEAGLDDDATFACELATDEACTNIVEHAYQGREGGKIYVRCQCTPEEFIVELHDNGAPFNPAQVAPPQLVGDLADREAGGLGLHLMRSLMDEVRFEFDGQNGNTVTMIKRL